METKLDESAKAKKELTNQNEELAKDLQKTKEDRIEIEAKLNEETKAKKELADQNKELTGNLLEITAKCGILEGRVPEPEKKQGDGQG